MKYRTGKRALTSVSSALAVCGLAASGVLALVFACSNDSESDTGGDDDLVADDSPASDDEAASDDAKPNETDDTKPQTDDAKPDPDPNPTGGAGEPAPTSTNNQGGSSGENGTNDGGSTSGGEANMAGDGGSGGSEPNPVDPGVCVAPKVNENPGNTCYGSAPPPLKLTPIARVPDLPTDLAQPPGDDERLFVTGRRGNIYIIKNGELLDDPFFTPPQSIVAGGEQGLLGLAFAPDYAESGEAWIHYSGGSGKTVLVSIQRDPNNPDRATGGAERDALFTVDQFASNHNGGQLRFGPDGCLYLGLGDGGRGNDPEAYGQNKDVALGSILRIDVDNYPKPAEGNPFPGMSSIDTDGTGAEPHTWAWGLRNPWKFSFDTANGDLYIADVGQNMWEEVNVEPGGRGGVNYGWKEMEGAHCRGQMGNSGNCERNFRYPAVDYVQTIPPSGGNRIKGSVTGGYVYRGSIPNMAGRYIYAEYVHHWVKSFVYSGEQDSAAQVCDEHDLFDDVGPVTSLGQDNKGEIYVLTSNGNVSRIDAE